MAEAHAMPSTQSTAPPPHRGSASTTLTGRTLLATWLLSIALHGGGLVLMFLIVFPFASRGQDELPVAKLDIVGPLDAPPVVAPPRPSLSQAQTKSNVLQQHIAPQPEDRLSELQAAKKPELSIIGVGSGGGDFSKYGLSGGSGTGPDFFGLGGSARGARRIVYVVDRSASMLDTFVFVREELRRSISALRRSQKFHVIFFSAGRPVENPPKRLVSAIRAQKDAFFEFLSGLFPEGGTNPAPAMRRALATDPDLIYFLTDGEFDEGLIQKLDQWNRKRRVRIFTIAFFDRSGAELLERIAREHGGEFKFVSEQDVR